MFKGLSFRHYLFYFFIIFFELHSLFVFASDAKIPASTFKNKSMLSQLQPVFTFTAGASLSQLGQAQSFAPIDLCRYRYQPNDTNTTNMLWGGFVGSEVIRSSSWSLIGGLGYYQPNYLSTKGILTQGADSVSDNSFSYRYQTQSQQLLAEGKLYWIAKESIQPFLMIGIGAAFNNTFNYQTNVPPFLEFTPEFSNHRQTNYTYAIGPGIDISISKSIRIGMAYRFTDLGSANTGSAQIDAIPISNTLNQSHLYANQILAQLTFIPWTRD